VGGLRRLGPHEGALVNAGRFVRASAIVTRRQATAEAKIPTFVGMTKSLVIGNPLSSRPSCHPNRVVVAILCHRNPLVIPAEAGILARRKGTAAAKIPAFAGMTGEWETGAWEAGACEADPARTRAGSASRFRVGSGHGTPLCGSVGASSVCGWARLLAVRG
jgi:hypothetical protein